jgi:hypothetical protein
MLMQLQKFHLLSKLDALKELQPIYNSIFSDFLLTKL